MYDPHVTDVSSDDAALLYLQYSTRWDSFAHIGSMFDADGDGQPERVFYNGWRGGSDIPDVEDRGVGEPRLERFPSKGTEALGIHNFARHGLQGRGVLANLKDVVGEKRGGNGDDMLMQAMDQQTETGRAEK